MKRGLIAACQSNLKLMLSHLCPHREFPPEIGIPSRPNICLPTTKIAHPNPKESKEFIFFATPFWNSTDDQPSNVLIKHLYG
jgi:hypothetical protein